VSTIIFTALRRGWRPAREPRRVATVNNVKSW
jgi:hypothetical protein